MKKVSLTQTQLGIYADCMARKEQPLYHLSILTKLKPEADLHALAKAIEIAASAHSFARVRFGISADGMPYQYLNDTMDLDLKMEQMSDAEFEAVRQKLPERMPLINAPLVHFRIIETPSAKWFYHVYHHTIFDGSSYLNWAKDISKALNNEPITVEGLSIIDIAEREEKKRQSPAYNDAKAWYAKTFGGITAETLPLPDVDSHSAAAQIPQMKCLTRTLAANFEQTFAASRRLGVKLSTVVDGAFGYMAGMFAGTNEAQFCTIYNGRKSSVDAQTICFMVKTLPVYCHWTPETGVAEYLQSLQDQREVAKMYDLYSFAEACNDLQLKHDLFFSYRGNLNESNFDINGLQEENIVLTPLMDSYAMNFIVDHRDDQLVLTVEYHAEKYSDKMAETLANAYDFVLKQLISAAQLNEIALVEAAEQLSCDQQYHTEMAYDDSQTVVDLFRQQVQKTPDNVAVVLGEKRLTYAEIDDLTDRIAAHLHANGIGRSDVVAIIIPRNEFMTIASIGVLKAGAAYQPLDPSYPTERLQFMVQDTAAKLLIADENMHDFLSDFSGKVLLTNEIKNLAKVNSQEVLAYKPAPSDRFILLYTSGSTGTPKGCQLLHSNLVSFIHAIQPIYHYDSSSRVTAYASYGFDANIYEQYPALIHGSQSHIIDDEIRFDLVALNNYFMKEGITHAFMTTQVARAYATSVEIPKTLKYLSLGGETLVPFDCPEGLEVRNLYGPTEATVFVTQQLLDQNYDRVPIGQANPNMRVYVVDKNGNLLPPYALGELCVAGAQVALGYLHCPEKTAEVFVENPFTEEEKFSRMYRTGDVVRRMANGSIDFIGRNDGQVKVRGFRIELSEVEGVIRQFNHIKDATVVAFDDPAGGKFVAAYIVSDQTIDIAQLNDFIAKQKPPYMVPAVTMQIEKIPLNQNHKVDKRALPIPELQAQPASEQPAARTLNTLEKLLQELVISVLKKEDVAIATPLELLGLTSISSIKLAMAIYKRLNFELKTSEILRLSIFDIENKLLEHWLMGKMTEKEEKPTVNAEESPFLNERLPLTISQQGVYADCMRNPQSVSYNVPVLYRFPKSQNPEQLADCVRQVVENHPYLHTYFTLSGTDVEQTIAPNQAVQIDLQTMSDEAFTEYKRTFVRPFNLLKAPLYRMAVVRTKTAVYLLIDVHHIIFDGSSLSVFLGELQTLLNGAPLASEKTSFADYVHKELETDKSEAKQFFAEMLADCESASEITPDLPPLVNGVTGENITIHEPLDFEKINAFCQQRHITPAALTLAATGYVVSRFVGTRNAYLSTISTGRNDIHFADTIGMFVKTLPVAVQVNDISAGEFAEQTATMLRNTVEHEIYPYSAICSDYNYLPNILFAYQIDLEDNMVVNGKKIVRENLGVDAQKFKLEIFIENHNGRPSVGVSYKNGLYSAQLMRTLACAIRRVAKTIATKPDQRVRTISMLGPGDLTMLKQFSSTALNVDIPIKVFHQLFENQVDKQPDREILTAKDGTFTYRQLEERANRVANALISRGLQKGDSVVVLLHRTSSFFASVFGVNKAGGVFIPSSPDYPQERIKTIIEDSSARFIITENEMAMLYENSLAIGNLLLHPDHTRPNIPVLPTDLVYMIYTSGSTGKPKGVELRHESICNYLTNHKVNPHISKRLALGTCYASVITVAFDGSFDEWAMALCNGLKLVFISDEGTLDPLILARELTENNVDIFTSTPSRLLQFMEIDAFAQAMKNCKVIGSGGEKFPTKLIDLLQEKTNATIINLYGPTEATVGSNVDVYAENHIFSVGKPLLNCEEYIVDTDDNLLPIGVVGELIICGVGVANGYHNLPEQTAAAFVTFNGKKAYRTGDYARWLPNREVEILGRKDNQVKLRGLRIELGEIESQLTNVEGIKSGTVLIRKVGNQEAICAYYTLKEGVSITSEEIRNAMAQHLTDYMVPHAFVLLTEFPLTSNGKINTKALPEPKQLDRHKGRLPENDGEQLFAKIFSEILEVTPVYAGDNFFELGGSSLTVTRVIIAAGKAGIGLAYADVFDNPTPEKLALFTHKDNTAVSATNADFEDIAQYDYEKIDNLLSANTLDNFTKGEKQSFSHVLLTGATGFLGIHVLNELLHNYPDCRVTCLLRGKGSLTAQARLDGMFFYYFEQLPSEFAADRITIVNGDITQKSAFALCQDLDIDLVINCAANVKHFSKGTDIEDVNYFGTLNIIDFCKAKNVRLVHTSTSSIGGAFVDTQQRVTGLYETMLYIGQKQLSKYTQSKFLAERAILQAVADGELSAKIMRLGNLAPRDRDGEYQINFKTNSFMARIKSTYLVGTHSYESEVGTFELSPIDSVAQAILLLANSPKENVVFHPYNNHELLMGDLYDTMNRLKLSSKAMEESDYQAALEIAEQDPAKASVLTGLLAYRQSGNTKIYYIKPQASLTVAVLARLGFHWPVTDNAYTERFLSALRGLGFFDE